MTIINPLPYTLTNGTTADATQVMADFNQIVANVNSNAAHNGANSDITSLSGLTTPLSVAQGGTGAGTFTAGDLLAGNGTSAISDTGISKNAVPPTGTILMFATTSAPTGWLTCDGSAVSRTTYATLFGVIGTTFGTGDGSTTFNVPDLRGRSPIGYDAGGATGRMTGNTAQGVNANAVGNSGGEQAHTLTASESAVLTYTSSVTDPGHIHGIDNGTASSSFAQSASTGNSDQQRSTHSATTGITVATSSNAGGGIHNNVQPGLVINFIIKT